MLSRRYYSNSDASLLYVIDGCHQVDVIRDGGFDFSIEKEASSQTRCDLGWASRASNGFHKQTRVKLLIGDVKSYPGLIRKRPRSAVHPFKVAALLTVNQLIKKFA